VDLAPAGGGTRGETGGVVPAITRESLTNSAFLARAVARLEQDGQYPEALRLWEEALATSPDSPLIANNLAWVLVTYPEELRDAARAVGLAEAAVGGEAGNSAYLNTLGVARYRAGDFRGAVNALLQNARASGTVTAWDGLFVAMALQHLGLENLAATYYQNARRWLSRHPDLPRDEKRQLRAFLAEAAELFEGRGTEPVTGEAKD
jgi:tetratricopeptide (TPR) repeat protein